MTDQEMPDLPEPIDSFERRFAVQLRAYATTAAGAPAAQAVARAVATRHGTTRRRFTWPPARTFVLAGLLVTGVLGGALLMAGTRLADRTILGSPAPARSLATLSPREAAGMPIVIGGDGIRLRQAYDWSAKAFVDIPLYRNALGLGASPALAFESDCSPCHAYITPDWRAPGVPQLALDPVAIDGTSTLGPLAWNGDYLARAGVDAIDLAIVRTNASGGMEVAHRSIPVPGLGRGTAIWWAGGDRWIAVIGTGADHTSPAGDLFLVSIAGEVQRLTTGLALAARADAARLVARPFSSEWVLQAADGRPVLVSADPGSGQLGAVQSLAAGIAWADIDALSWFGSSFVVGDRLVAAADGTVRDFPNAPGACRSTFAWSGGRSHALAKVINGDLVLHPESGATTLVPGICGPGETATLVWSWSSDDRLLVGVNGANGRFRLYHVNADGKSDPQPFLLLDTVGPGNEQVFWNY